MNIAILSGSFNPVHIGHLILGNYVTEFTGTDEVWYLVSPRNPLKDGSALLPGKIRLKMVEKALLDYPKLKASDFEFSLPLPSYTINTLRNLKHIYPQHTFSLLIGADNWVSFDKWKDYQEIIDNFNILVYPRIGYEVKNDIIYSQVKLLSSPIVEISSTFIRDNIKAGKNMRAFLPDNVYRYILENKLYSD